ncbi:MAG TPA: ATP-binding protein [Candidatus Obscuribacterales bacterium]
MKAAINTEDIYRCLVENSADGYLVSNQRGAIVYCNPAFAKLIGKKAEQIEGGLLSQYLDDSAAKDGSHTQGNGLKSSGDSGTTSGGKEKTESAQESLPFRPLTVFGRNGLELTMPGAQFPVIDAEGKPVGHLTILYIVQAQTVQQAQTEFVSTVSHELRTPLTSIKGFADTILRAGDRLEQSQQRRYVGIIKDQADRLTRLVEDLLAVSRLESKKLQLTIRAIDFKEAVQRVHRNLTEKARNHTIVENIPPGLPPVWADADRLEQILTNLIDNAIKYSPPDTIVTINARDVPGTPEMVEFSVTDQGVGIPQEHLPEIFSKFSRLDNPLTRQTEGTGLGLYITRSLVLALGGQIKVSSAPGGTTFTVQLPASSLEEQAARGRD